MGWPCLEKNRSLIFFLISEYNPNIVGGGFMSNERIGRLEERINNVEEKLTRIEKDVSQLSEIKATVGRIETKLDERAKAVDQRFDDQDKRIDRLGFRFWSMIVGIGVIIVVYIVKIREYLKPPYF